MCSFLWRYIFGYFFFGCLNRISIIQGGMVPLLGRGCGAMRQQMSRFRLQASPATHRKEIRRESHYLRCIWGWLWLLRIPSQGYHYFPYDMLISIWTQVSELHCVYKKLILSSWFHERDNHLNQISCVSVPSRYEKIKGCKTADLKFEEATANSFDLAGLHRRTPWNSAWE